MASSTLSHGSSRRLWGREGSDEGIEPREDREVSPRIIEALTLPRRPSEIVDTIGTLDTPPVAPETYVRLQRADEAKRPFTVGHVWAEIVSGVKLACRVIVPTWLVLWGGGTIADRAIDALSPPHDPLVTRPLSTDMQQRIQLNSTPLFGADTRATAQEQWNSLEPLREAIRAHSPEMSQWFESLHERGKIKIVLGSEGENSGRHSEWRKWSGELRLYSQFFTLSDGDKIVVLRHEKSHDQENPAEYFANSLAPQVAVGAIARAGATIYSGVVQGVGHAATSAGIASGSPFVLETGGKLAQHGADAYLWANETGWPFRWQYLANHSEREAMREEARAAKELGIASPQGEHPLSAAINEPSPVIPGQEIFGVGLGALILYGARRRPKAPAKDTLPTENGTTVPQLA